VDIFGKTVRFHHGHAINYQGGIGGIFIPAFKAISQWDKMRQADVDFFGHFHQHKDGSKFVSNGSLIGFNTYALHQGRLRAPEPDARAVRQEARAHLHVADSVHQDPQQEGVLLPVVRGRAW
jgi:hypothetical protein